MAATASTPAVSIKLPSPVPVNNNTYTGSSAQKSSLSRQVNHRHSPMRSRRTHTTAGGPDEDDAEGDEDMDENDADGADAEDQELYCYCQKLSYGEVRLSPSQAHRERCADAGRGPHAQMIACDNDGCRFQWVSAVTTAKRSCCCVLYLTAGACAVPSFMREPEAAAAGELVLRGVLGEAANRRGADGGAGGDDVEHDDRWRAEGAQETVGLGLGGTAAGRGGTRRARETGAHWDGR